MPVPPIPTIGELLRQDRDPDEWMWVSCNHAKCGYSAPVHLAPLVEQFGDTRSSDFLRKTGLCPKCGSRGVSLTRRSWAITKGGGPGWQDFPTHYRNGLWSARPFEPAPEGSDGEGKPIDTRPPGPFKFGP